MKLLLLSDNHGRWQQVHGLIEAYRPQVDLILHCGDSEFQPDDPVWEQVDAVVTGNNDYDPEYPDQLVISTPVGRIFLTHGHYHHVYFGTQRILQAAKDHQCQFAFHGHTHVAYAKMEDGVFLCNPGSFNYSRGPIPDRTYALLDIGERTIQVDFYNEQGERIESLSQCFDRPSPHKEADHD